MQEEFIHTITNTLDLLTDTYHYNHWIYSLMRPHLGDRILEVGAGIGNITQFLLPSKEVVCLDLEDEYVNILKEYARTHSNIIPVQLSLLDLPAEQAPPDYFDTVLCINVLEHIEDDLLAVQKMASVLKPGGKLWLYVPAGRWAYGALDQELGHFRRYNRARLKSVVRDAGLKLHECHYVNFIGAFGWYWSARVRKDRVIRRENAHLMDQLVPYLSAIERLVRPPIGQSLLLAATRPEEL